MSEQFTHAESIVVSAAPEEVYAVVSDIARTGEWSPICKECHWEEGDGPRVDAWFTGRNVSGEREWTTRSRVVEATPGEAFAWSVGKGYVNWAYRMRAVEGGTELTETWEFTEAGQAFFVEKYGDRAQTEMASRRKDALSGIPETLATLKRIIEQG